MNVKYIMTQFPKWMRMVLGKNILTVEQGIGKNFNKETIKGYYNDLTNKVSDNALIDDKGVPYNITNDGQHIYTPVNAIQYGLALYDLYLSTNEKKYIDKLEPIIKHVLKIQHPTGGWSVDLQNSSRNYYSAMAQGEALSLLIRAKKILPEFEYDIAIEKAYDVLSKDVAYGGCCRYDGEDAYLMEYVDNAFVLNGGIFGAWGLYDYYLSEYNSNNSRKLLNVVIGTLSRNINKFDLGFWSLYDQNGMISSPFYHQLHIAQLKVMEILFPNNGFGKIASKFEKYENSRWCKLKAVAIKGRQKLNEKPRMVIVK